MKGKSMKRIILSVAVGLGFGLLFWSCQKESPAGFDLLGRKDVGREGILTLQPAQKDTSYQLIAKTGKSGNLLLGQFQGYETRILLKFGELPDTAQVETAQLVLFPHAIYGDTTAAPLPISLHRITETWAEETAVWGDVEGRFESEPLGSFELIPSTSAADTFTIPASLVQEWIDHPEQNHGVLLKTRGSGFIKEYHSREGDQLNYPRLKLVYTKEGVRDTSDYKASGDVFIVESQGDLRSDRLYVGNGIACRSLLRFDFSTLPEKTLINYASLCLRVDQENTLKRTDYTFIIQIFRVTTPDWDPGTIEVDSTSVISQSIKEGDSLVVNIASFVQKWVSDRLDGWENYGMLLSSKTEGSDISRLAFFSSEADIPLSPKLTLYYSLPPSKF